VLGFSSPHARAREWGPAPAPAPAPTPRAPRARCDIHSNHTIPHSRAVRPRRATTRDDDTHDDDAHARAPIACGVASPASPPSSSSSSSSSRLRERTQTHTRTQKKRTSSRRRRRLRRRHRCATHRGARAQAHRRHRHHRRRVMFCAAPSAGLARAFRAIGRSRSMDGWVRVYRCSVPSFWSMIGQRTPSGYREGLNLHCPGVRLPMYVYLYIYVMTVVVF